MKILNELIIDKNQLISLEDSIDSANISNIRISINGSFYNYVKGVFSDKEILKYKKIIMKSEDLQIDFLKNYKKILNEKEINFIIDNRLSSKSYKNNFYNAKEIISLTGKSYKEIEKYMIKNTRVAVGYCIQILKDRWKEIEPLIATSPLLELSDYSQHILKKRWVDFPDIDPKIARLAEENLSKRSDLAASYAIYVLKKRWIDVEDIPKDIAEHAEEIIRKDEESPDWIMGYAKKAINGRWKEAENTIAGSEYSLEYAYIILKKAWRDFKDIDQQTINYAEENIAKNFDSEEVMGYIRRFLKMQFLLAELRISGDEKLSNEYVIKYLNDKISFDFINKNISNSYKKIIETKSKDLKNRTLLRDYQLRALSINNISFLEHVKSFNKSNFKEIFNKINNNQDEYCIIFKKDEENNKLKTEHYQLISGEPYAIARTLMELPIKAIIIKID